MQHFRFLDMDEVVTSHARQDSRTTSNRVVHRIVS
jgi:hypothetical protein